MTKRIFDMVIALAGVVVLSPLMLVLAVMIKLDSKGPVIFKQERMGRYLEPFEIYKFRSMYIESQDNKQMITVRGDSRVTPVGRFLRRTKFDELPQLINVIKGDMSLVGPRPEVRKYVEMFRADYEKLMELRPGITDPASIRFSDEERILAEAEDWEKYYTEQLLPEKLKLAMRYLDEHNLLLDIKLIMKTVLRVS